MSPQAVIFDMDGIIMDSEPLWRRAEIHAYKKYDILLTEDMCRSTAGLRLVQVIEHWQRKFGYADETKTALFAEIHTEVVNLVNAEGKGFEGLVELLQHLKNLQYKIALASGSSHEIIQAVLNRLKIREYFEVIRSGDDEIYGKPHPQIFINAAKDLKVEPQDCWVIEDSANGVIAGRAARMKVIAMPEEEVKDNPVFKIADQVVASLKEVPAIIK